MFNVSPTAELDTNRSVDQTHEQKIVVIGAGPAGLTAAYELTKRGVATTVLERDAIVGGLARTETYEGYHFDMGGHRFFTKSDEVNTMWQDVLAEEFLRRPRLSRIYYKKRFFSYPLKPLNALMGLGIVESCLILLSYIRWQLFPYRVEETFEQWVTNRFGQRLFLTFFKTYTEKVWGISCSELRAEWAAQRIKDLSVKTIILSMFRKPGTRIKTLNALPRSLFTQVTHAGDHFVIGTFSHQKNLSGGIFSPITVSVYADDEGWLMAYFPNTFLVAEIINKGFGNSFLEVALFVAAIEAGLPEGIGGKEDQIGYYHWAFPEAAQLALGRKDPPFGNFYFAIPNQAILFDVSAAKDCSSSDTFSLYGLAPTCQAGWVVTVPLMDGIPAGRVVDSGGNFQFELARPPDLAPGGPPLGEVQTIAFPKGEWMGVTILYSMTPAP